MSGQRELLADVERLGGRAMSRLNKLRVGGSVRQQQLLAEARDYITEVLDLVQAAADHLDDDHGIGIEREGR